MQVLSTAGLSGSDAKQIGSRTGVDRSAGNILRNLASVRKRAASELRMVYDAYIGYGEYHVR